MSKWREALRSVPDAELPHLRAQMTDAARALGLLSAILAPLLATTDIARGAALPERAVISCAFDVGGFLLVWRLASTAWGRRRGDLLVLGFVFHMIVALSIIPLTTRSGTNHFVGLAPTLPVLLASFVPWRPTFSLLIAGPCALFPLGVALAVQGPTAGDPWFQATLAVCCGMFAAGANQLHRRLWRQLGRARAQLTAVARTCALGEMTAGIAHELKTPIAAALNDLAGAKALTGELDESIGHPDVDDEDLRAISREMRETVGRVEQAVARTARFVQAIRAQTIHTEGSSTATFSVGERAKAVVPLFAHRLRKGSVRLEVDDALGRMFVSGDAAKLEQVLVNLIGNALDACLESGVGALVRVTGSSDNGSVTVVVEDDGPGVPKELRSRVFDPLFTTRAAGEGTGLGLSIARDVAEAAFGGTLKLVSSERGARFELSCPDAGAASLRRIPWLPAVAGAGGRHAG